MIKGTRQIGKGQVSSIGPLGMFGVGQTITTSGAGQWGMSGSGAGRVLGEHVELTLLYWWRGTVWESCAAMVPYHMCSPSDVAWLMAAG